MAKYEVSWKEDHSIIVEAKDEDDAQEVFMDEMDKRSETYIDVDCLTIEVEEVLSCGTCGRPATHTIGEDMNRCDRCID